MKGEDRRLYDDWANSLFWGGPCDLIESSINGPCSEIVFVLLTAGLLLEKKVSLTEKNFCTKKFCHQSLETLSAIFSGSMPCSRAPHRQVDSEQPIKPVVFKVTTCFSNFQPSCRCLHLSCSVYRQHQLWCSWTAETLLLSALSKSALWKLQNKCNLNWPKSAEVCQELISL